MDTNDIRTAGATAPRTLYHRCRRSVADRLANPSAEDPNDALGADLVGVELTERPPAGDARRNPEGEGESAGVLDTVLLRVEGLGDEHLRGRERRPSAPGARVWDVPPDVVRAHAVVTVIEERDADRERAGALEPSPAERRRG